VFLCGEPLANNEFCNSHPDCASGFCDPVDRRCAPSVDPGEPCPSYNHAECKDGYCSDTIPTDFTPSCDAPADCSAGSGMCDLGLDECVPVCIPRKNDGQSCTFGANYECLSDQCVNGTCRTGCATSADCCTCGDANVCAHGFCVTAGEAAPVCQLAADCSSGQCIDAVCR